MFQMIGEPVFITFFRNKDMKGMATEIARSHSGVPTAAIVPFCWKGQAKMLK